MQDELIGRLSLAISLGVHHGREASLAAQAVEVVRELASVKLSAIVEDHGARDAEPGDYVAPYEFTHFSDGYGCDSLGFDPFGKVVYRHKRYLHWPVALGKGPRMSIPHVANGRGLTIGVMMVEGAR